MKFEAKNLSPVAFHALTCAEVSVSNLGMQRVGNIQGILETFHGKFREF